MTIAFCAEKVVTQSPLKCYTNVKILDNLHLYSKCRLVFFGEIVLL